MSISLVQASVEVFVPYLHNLSALLDKAAAFADARGINPADLLQARLAPDMYNLIRQVCEANRHATIACALLARPCAARGRRKRYGYGRVEGENRRRDRPCAELAARSD